MPVRKAQIDDLDILIKLWFEMMNFHINQNGIYKMKNNSKEIYKIYAKECINYPQKTVLVYEENDTVLGYIFAEINVLPPVYEEEKIGILTEIGVTERVRRKGIGKLLLKEAEKWIGEQGANRTECIVSVTNTVSQAFWKKNGYIGYNKICYKYIKKSKMAT